MINLKRHTNIALGYFLLVGLLGILLRLFFVTPIAANYRWVVHTHSHIALLGWVYIALTTLIYKLYFTEANKGNLYRRIFWFSNVTILGMLVTFPFQGYALFSIIFSSLFLVSSYFFAWFVLKHTPSVYRETYSFKCIKAALWYMIFSSIGPWSLGAIMVTLGKTSMWYKMAIYYYLHFQYNAWFILVLLGILFFLLDKAKLSPEKKEFRSFFLLINSGIILSFFLSVLWVEPHAIFYILAAAGAVLQVMAFYKLYLMLKKVWQKFKISSSAFVGFLLKISGVLMIGKILMQLLTAIPYFADLSFLYTDFVIGYLHWVFLGIVSIAIFAFFQHFKLMKLPKPIFSLYFTGFVLSEALIFYKGASMWLGLPFFSEYFPLLVLVSSLILISVGILLVKNIRS